MLHFRQGLLQGLPDRYVLGGVDMDFILKCSLPKDKRTEAKDVGEQIAARALEGIRGEYMFVAKIQRVERIDRLITKATSEEIAEIKLDDSPHFIAMGECLAVKYLGK